MASLDLFTSWVIIELFTLLLIKLFTKNTFQYFEYLLNQNIASILFLFSVTFFITNFQFTASLLFSLFFMYKLALFPFYFWYKKFLTKISIKLIFFFSSASSVLKLTLLFIFVTQINLNLILFLAISGSFLIALEGMMETFSFSSFFVFSSLINIHYWILNFIFNIWTLLSFSIIYLASLTMATLCYYSNFKISMSWLASVTLLGLPPLPLFFMKLFLMTSFLNFYTLTLFLLMNFLFSINFYITNLFLVTTN
uniref:NADH dehydrogenase subunit 2 n=1 Tax=Gnathostomula paradoxa TaxID=66783 RepID=A0A0F6Q2V4_9BILA|nr:NADH dehydrogenase subunit 2 [Gnathostomula paradoxa]AKD00042.1 NADH dehydrogenase subunit 2 [Gnathostomula paradoxa]